MYETVHSADSILKSKWSTQATDSVCVFYPAHVQQIKLLVQKVSDVKMGQNVLNENFNDNVRNSS